ncbi:cell wall hydrolase SleB [Nitrosococcus halophilus Nc 4]|uniref:Cell wall hydrolase SleB n=1 Tax=Nitrosococcus halophilus (strain Nc4) TaxID=472759 RepID=D5C3S6_NITHN|nr:cell wall hydrolase [Nitrosococcus halophilus]ADE15048.1 cell wall hydrolase SleB [Nitrosococcus halophilus Nc 4]
MIVLRTTVLITLVLSLGWVKPSQATNLNEKEVRCLALNLYWEARSEGREGMVAVGWVVLNRMDDSRYPATVCSIVYQGGESPPCEWNWWCDGRSDRPREKEAWKKAQKVAQLLLTHPPPDPTQGALWYHHTSTKTPPWLRKRKRTALIGKHVFYR